MIPVVFIPGLMCDARLYAPQIAALGARPHLVADTTRDDRIAGMAARLLAQGPERFVLAGLSMGGMVAMEVMAQAPGRVAAALLMDTDPFPSRPVETEFRAGLLARGKAGFAQDFAPRFFAHRTDAQDIAAQVADMAADCPDAVLHRQCAALDHRGDMLAALAGCAVPTIILYGEEDVICRPKGHHKLDAVLARSEIVALPQTGHIATLERPEAVTGALLRALEMA